MREKDGRWTDHEFLGFLYLANPRGKEGQGTTTRAVRAKKKGWISGEENLGKKGGNRTHEEGGKAGDDQWRRLTESVETAGDNAFSGRFPCSETVYVRKVGQKGSR